MSSNISSDSGLQREQSLFPPGKTMSSPTDRKVSENFTGNYPYQPLQSDGHVRLLLLESPASSSTQDIPVISATLHEVNLSVVGETPCPSYKALSYEWGLPPSNPSDTPTMLLDNYTIHIRQNLYDALHSILHNHHQLYGESPLYLWVDALCINQLDDREKGHQVQLMKKIYETAKMVIIWLGMGTEHTDSGMKVLDMEWKELYRYIRAEKLTKGEELGISYLYYKATYWRRVWILQEFVLARDYVVLCNRAFVVKRKFEMGLGLGILRDSVLEDKLQNVVNEPNPSRPSKLLLHLFYSPVNRIISLRDWRVYSPASLDDWLDMLSGVPGRFRVTDPRDYVFAMLGIAHDGDRIVPDYELSTWEVYCLALSTRSARHKIWADDHFYLYLADTMGIPADRASELQQRLKSEDEERSGLKIKLCRTPTSGSTDTL